MWNSDRDGANMRCAITSCAIDPAMPAWARPSAGGKRQDWAQSMMAFADYYCVDGSADAGANSIDGTSASRFALSLPRLDAASRQVDMFSDAHDSLEEAQRASDGPSLAELVRT
ncbi:hypothetical protein [Burkholderia ubonensis]|uniref:hypothetical protein n=1 Tax=Burkholderia ubonensis TaxID=101571 RepID=UPI0007590D7F|nr:hypothetical protein [Burkholderia ubonensis]KWK61846.1 hypothetical protein WM15_12990 [Burkholderia ubonensis]